MADHSSSSAALLLQAGKKNLMHSVVQNPCARYHCAVSLFSSTL